MYHGTVPFNLASILHNGFSPSYGAFEGHRLEARSRFERPDGLCGGWTERSTTTLRPGRDWSFVMTINSSPGDTWQIHVEV